MFYFNDMFLGIKGVFDKHRLSIEFSFSEQACLVKYSLNYGSLKNQVQASTIIGPSRGLVILALYKFIFSVS